MDRSLWLCLILAAAFALAAPQTAHADPDLTVREASQVLQELMSIPGRQIPTRLLADAQGLVIVPNVLKIGFIAFLPQANVPVTPTDAVLMRAGIVHSNVPLTVPASSTARSTAHASPLAYVAASCLARYIACARYEPGPSTPLM